MDKVAKRWIVRIAIGAILALQVIILYSLKYGSQSNSPELSAVVSMQDTSISLKGLPSYGAKATARVAILEFSDFECPFCRQHAESTYPKIVETFVTPGQVVYVTSNFPLPIHRSAFRLAEYGSCAAQLGAYWPLRDLMVQAAEPRTYDEQAVVESLHLDPSKFHDCMKDERTVQSIEAQIRIGHDLNADATPTFYIGLLQDSGDTLKAQRTIKGAQPYEVFQSAIEDLLN